MWIILIGFPNTNDFVFVNVSPNSPATTIADLPQADL